MRDNIKNIVLFCVGMILMATMVAEPAKLLQVAGPTPPSSYMIELPVNGYDDIERDQCFVQALKSMLIASSNNPNITNLPAVKNALAKAGLYIRRFNYINKNIPANKPSLFLQINFDTKSIDKLLQRASEVVWINSKPLALIWLAKDVDKGKILAYEGFDEGLTYLIRKKAQDFGMPIMLPTLDLQDINSIKAYDVCHFNLDVIKAASRRYGTPLLIIGCVKPSFLSKMWSSQWLLLQGAKIDRFSFTGNSTEDVVMQALQVMAQNIRGVVTQVSGQGIKVVLRVSNVSGLDQYNDVVKYLHDFSKVITQIDLVNISATEVELAINVIGGKQALINVLDARDKLVPNPDVITSPPGVDLDYKWVTLENERPQTASIKPVS